MLKKFRIVFSLLLIFGFSATLVGEEKADTYFPHIIGSYWVYEDPDGNELTRRVIENKEIDGETYHAFSYEPALEDWTDYDYHIHPYLYQIGEERVTFLVRDEVEKAVKAHFTKEMEALLEMSEEVGEPYTILYDIATEAQEQFYVLPTPVPFNEKWNATEIKAKVTMRSDPPQDPEAFTLEFTIVETGNVVGTEDVETPAGTFENCLKIEYRTETKVAVSPSGLMDLNPPSESVTTLWMAPNIGIVKFHQKAADILLKTFPMLPGGADPPIVRTPELKLELKRYEVKPVNTGDK